MSRKQRPRILLLDEDQLFAERLRQSAGAMGLEVHWRRSLFELGSVGRLGDYDALLVEPSIGPVNGLEIAEYAATFFPGLPVLLVSNQEPSPPLSRWPEPIVGFVRKDTAPDDLLETLRPRFEPARPPRRATA